MQPINAIRGWLLIFFSIALTGVILINRDAAHRAEAMKDALKLPPIETIWRPQVISAPSGTPMIIYDRNRMRVVLVDKIMPRGLEVCLRSICLLDTEWQRLYDDSQVRAAIK